ncbi:DUF3592 domain-containing protein [Novilysobacter luteus]|uniref:DUF3592 domain-containing protein n=1 Tax=Novilysobacter luteus TaxID=2822368 RepID=A0ABM8UCN7_9GAMM|nr:DUF3592 domain-containing protein [Lysobacter luteus]CAG4968923.1 hypothetical protein LYB30171_00381 [Lysobacter luteus]
MISFKMAPENHAKLSRLSKKFFMVVFVVGAALLAYKGVESYRYANSILADHTVVTVPVVLVDVSEERGRKGRTRNMYNFGYVFEADGREYEGSFTTSESNADPYLADLATIDVAYTNADPSRFDRLERLQGQAGFGSLMMRLLVAISGAALLAGLMHLLLVAKLIVPRPVEAAPAA